MQVDPIMLVECTLNPIVDTVAYSWKCIPMLCSTS